MQHADAQQLAHDLMKAHGLLADGWRFAWGRGKRRLGAVEVRKYPNGRVTRTIRLSHHLVRLNDEPAVRDVLLHEIAHALAGLHHGHDAHWKSICRKIGAKPQRLADETVRTPPAPYALVCGACHQTVGHRHRRIAPARLAEFYCQTCGPASAGKLQLLPATSHPAQS